MQFVFGCGQIQPKASGAPEMRDRGSAREGNYRFESSYFRGAMGTFTYKSATCKAAAIGAISREGAFRIALTNG